MDKIFEIRDAYTNEVLVDKLSPKEAIEAFKLYQDYFGANSVIMTHCHGLERVPHISREQEYKNEFIEYFAELQLIGNLL